MLSLKIFPTLAFLVLTITFTIANANHYNKENDAKHRRIAIFRAKVRARMTPEYSRKFQALQTVITKVHVCFHRFQKCSRKLSAKFCVSNNNRMAFYLWARRMADSIMNGDDDGHNFTCSPAFMRDILYGALSKFTKSYLQ